MSDWNLAAKSQEKRDKVNVDLAASGVAYKDRMNMPVCADIPYGTTQCSWDSVLDLQPSYGKRVRSTWGNDRKDY